MTIKDIVADWLNAHGCDGLCIPDSCGCGFALGNNGLFPCGDPNMDECEAAKYNVQDGLYYPVADAKKTHCILCNGKGYIEQWGGEERDCPACKGKGWK